MKKAIMLLLLFGSNMLNAQSPRGITLTSPAKPEKIGKTYALIVGISKYKNSAIPQLQFADKDAIAFKDYLLASGVDSNNIVLRINEQARYADIMLDLDDICTNKAKAGERVFIYFSGHGDVESHVVTNDGYLLPYDAPKVVYAISAINVKILQTYVATLSSKGVQVVVITDACHSGNLAGGLEGLKNIQTVLSSKWQDEIKILSCQSGELSLEGKQWGGGRGLFSYELINGMAGMADRNKDGKVTLSELNRYLADKVADDASPVPQNPILSGDMSAEVSKVNLPLLTYLSSGHTNELASIDVKGFDEALLKGLDDKIIDHYHMFNLFMDSGLYFTSFNTQNTPCAFYHFLRIPENESTRILLSLMKRRMCVAFMKHAEETADIYLQNKISSIRNNQLKSLIQEMKALRVILGDEKLKQLGFMDKVYFFQAMPYLWKHDKESLENGLAIIDSSLRIQPNVLGLVLKGSFQNGLGNMTNGIITVRQALERSPHLGICYIVLSEAYYKKSQYDSSIITVEKAMDIDTSYWYDMYQLKLNCFYKMGIQDSIDYYLNQKMRDSVSQEQLYKVMSMVYEKDKNYLKSKDMLLASLKYAPNETQILYGLTYTYSLLGDKQNSLLYFEQTLGAGWKDFDHLQEDTDLDNIRTTPEFKALMRKYFPDQYKE